MNDPLHELAYARSKAPKPQIREAPAELYTEPPIVKDPLRFQKRIAWSSILTGCSLALIALLLLYWTVRF
jgi:hypothetical protein